MPFPDIDPVAIQLGPLAIRWYGLAYVFGLLLGIYLARVYVTRYPSFKLSRQDVEDFGFWSFLGIFVGGRLGSVLFYNFDFYVENPVEVLKTWKGGMSFHGGLLGVAIIAIWFCWKRRIRFLDLSDLIVCVAPIGLFLGRIANFINAELWWRPTSLPWGVVFPYADSLARHPSQLYEAALEGILLMILLGSLIRIRGFRVRAGVLTGIFLACYGIFRFLVEYTREPDAELIGSLTRGQAYSVPMVLIGAWMIVRTLVKSRDLGRHEM